MTEGGRARARVSVGIVEDHPITRHGLLAALATAGFGSLMAAESTESLVRMPQVVLCDLSLPPGCRQGAEAVEWLVGHGVQVIAFSAVGTADTQLAALAAGARGFLHKSAGADRIAAAVDAVAASGYWIEPALAGWLLQDLQDGAAPVGEDRRRQLAVLRALAQGDELEDLDRDQYWPAGTSHRVVVEAVAVFRVRDQRHRPSPRELEVIDCIGYRGMSVRRAAAELGMSESTVRTHLQSIKEKYLRLNPSVNPGLTPKAIAILWSSAQPRP